MTSRPGADPASATSKELPGSNDPPASGKTYELTNLIVTDKPLPTRPPSSRVTSSRGPRRSKVRARHGH
eukprot:365263-Prorocentrum_minimum.AAC.1